MTLEAMTIQNHHHNSWAREPYFPQVSSLKERGVSVCSSQRALCVSEKKSTEAISKTPGGFFLERSNRETHRKPNS